MMGYQLMNCKKDRLNQQKKNQRRIKSPKFDLTLPVMRMFAAISILLLFVSCQTIPRNGLVVTALAKQTLYPLLFDTTGRDWCIWKPRPEEKDFVNVADSHGMCHTRLDTLLFYDQGSKEVAVFGTYRLDDNGKIIDCHACAPIVSLALGQRIDNDYWKVTRFVKNFGEHGSWGGLPMFCIYHFGEHYFFTEDWGYFAQGQMEGWQIFWHLPSFVESMRINSYDDSGWKEDKKMVSSWNDSVSDASTARVTKVLVRKKGVVYDEGKGQHSVDSTRVYILNDSCIFKPVK